MRDKTTKLLEEAYRQVYLRENNEAEVLEKFASDIHEVWRKGYQSNPKNKDANGAILPRMKEDKDTGEMINIDVPFGELTPFFRKENEEAAKAARDAVRQFPNDEAKGADFIHNEWMKRNPKETYNAAQHVPYASLPQEEKDKDLVHYRNMKQALNA